MYIRHVIYSSHMLGIGDELSHAELIEVSERYAALVAEAIQAEFSDAEVEVLLKHRVSGAGSGTSTMPDDYEVERGVDWIADKVWSAGDFWEAE